MGIKKIATFPESEPGSECGRIGKTCGYGKGNGCGKGHKGGNGRCTVRFCGSNYGRGYAIEYETGYRLGYGLSNGVGYGNSNSNSNRFIETWSGEGSFGYSLLMRAISNKIFR